MFETERDVLDWYERQPRALDGEFARGVRWDEVRRHPLDPAFVPVLVYMRDVESYTDLYYREMLRTPTGRDPVIRRFMDRWGVEEADHAAVLNRFLGEAGVPTGPRWEAEARATIPVRYHLASYAGSVATNLLGGYFSGTHMVWGAINEMTTLQAYRRLWQSARHPVLEQILRAVAREESAHAAFYMNVARIKLERHALARGLARTVVERFGALVGSGARPRGESDYVVRILFGGAGGVEWFDRQVTRRVERLPGFGGLRTPTDRIAEAALAPAAAA